MHIDTQKYDNGKTAENTADATVTDVTVHQSDGGLIGIAPFSGPLGDVEIGEVVARNVVAGAVVQPDDAVMHYDRGNVARMRRSWKRGAERGWSAASISVQHPPSPLRFW